LTTRTAVVNPGPYGRGGIQPIGSLEGKKGLTEHTMDRQTVSIMKACEVVGVSRRTIYNWISAGKVEYVRTAGGSIRIFADTLWREPGESSRQTPGGTVAASQHV
jgi:excisionase family DNA binding protein